MASIKVIDGDGSSKYYQVIEGGTTALPYMSVVPDYHIAEAINRIETDYGDTVSVWDKAKVLRKFGRNTTVGTSFETIAEFQETEANETFVTTNIIDSIVSSNSGDTTQTIVIEGHTVDGSGNLTFVSQEKALTGQTEATLTTPLARVTRAYVKASGSFGTTPTALAGIVSIYDNTGGVSAGGVPNTASETKLTIQAGETQSQKCATATSSTDYWIIDNFSAAVGVAGGSASRAEVRIEIRDIANGGAWLPIGRNLELTVGQTGITYKLTPPLIVPPNHDVRVRAKVDSNTAEIVAELAGYLAEVQA